MDRPARPAGAGLGDDLLERLLRTGRRRGPVRARRRERSRPSASARTRARPLADLGASAYFATDFYEGAAHLVGALLDGPDRPYRDIFMSEPHFDRDALVMQPHATVAGAETWLHKSPYFEGKVDYWYAFAGDPTPAWRRRGRARSCDTDGTAIPPVATVDGLVTGMASSYAESPGWEGEPTVALPLELGGGLPDGRPNTVLVCADRCVACPSSTPARATSARTTSASRTCRTRRGAWSRMRRSRRA